MTGGISDIIANKMKYFYTIEELKEAEKEMALLKFLANKLHPYSYKLMVDDVQWQIDTVKQWIKEREKEEYRRDLVLTTGRAPEYGE